MINPTFILLHTNPGVLRNAERRIRQYQWNVSIKQDRDKLALLFPDDANKPNANQLQQLLRKGITLLNEFDDDDTILNNMRFSDENVEQSLLEDLSLKKPVPQLNQTFEKHSVICCIDFEAYFTNPLLISEIGIVRIENNKIVAQLHCFFDLDDEQMLQLKSIPAGKLSETVKCTRIYLPTENNFDKLKPKVLLNLENRQNMSKLIDAFCMKSKQNITDLQEQLKLDVEIKFFDDFTADLDVSTLNQQNNDFVILAKGIDLEQQALTEIFKCDIANYLGEVECYHVDLKQQDLNVQHIHSKKRPYQCCDYHKKRVADLEKGQIAEIMKKVESKKKINAKQADIDKFIQNEKNELLKKPQAHCALDDSYFVANQLIQ